MATSQKNKQNVKEGRTKQKEINLNLEDTISSNDSSLRLQEKEELQNLNDRLALYIEHVRKHEYSFDNEVKNSSLISLSKCHIDTEIDNLKDIYEYELSEARTLIDELTSERSKLLLSNQGLHDEIKFEKEKGKKDNDQFEKLKKDNKQTEDRIEEYEKKFSSLTKKISSLNDEIKEKQKSISTNEVKISTLKEDLNNKTLLWSTADNKLKSLKEVLEFDRHIHRQEVEELKKSLRTMEIEIESFKSHNNVDLNGILSEKLTELRKEFENEAYQTKLEIECEFHERIDSLANQNDRLLKSYNLIQDENIELRRLINQFKSETSDLTFKLANNEMKIKQLESDKSELLDSNKKLSNDYEKESKELNNHVHQLMTEYQHMSAVKIALDLEIAAYRKMLECEEQRLDIQTKLNDTIATSPCRPTKRARRIFDSSPIKNNQNFESDIRIASVDIHNNNFIRILNKSEKEQDISSWIIKCINGENIMEYKFPVKKLRPNSITTIWSTGSGMSKVVANDHMAKGVDKWPLSESCKVQLLCETGAVIHEWDPKSSILQRRNLAKQVRSEKCTMC